MLRKLLTLTACAALASACQIGPATTGPADSQPSPSSGEQSNLPPGSVPAPGQPVAFIDGQAVAWSELRPALIEASGGQVLMDIILEHQINRQLGEKGLQLTDKLIDEERAHFLATLSPDADLAQRLLDEVRLRRGLGKDRFRQLLRRNAGLRLLIQEQLQLTDLAIQNEFALEYGERYQARMILVPTLQAASDVVRQLAAGQSFIDLAIQESKDPSQAQGGLLPPINPADAGFPVAVRKAVAQLKPGQVSDPVSLRNGFAIFRLERKIDAQDVKLDDVKAALTERVRRHEELRLMQQLARTLLSQADVVVLDPTLDEGWKQQKKQLETQK